MTEQRIGSYRVIRKLGAGGMGTVYEAVHEQVERHVAIKVLHPHAAGDPETAKRFFNEARAVNIVPHPSIVGIFECGQLPDGSPYIIMEYLVGQSLRDRIQQTNGALGMAAVRLCRQVASALVEVHKNRIVHRDLKPDNVMVVADQEAAGGERAKLLDFGIAKLAAELDPDGSKTKTGAMLGTPRYMSPEQCNGSKQIDGKCDVYALGVMLYQVLAGRLPFTSDSPVHLMAMHIMEPPPRLRNVAPSVPAALAALVDAMLAKAPAERPTMAQVSAELQRFEGVPGGLPPTAMSLTRHRRAVLMACFGLLTSFLLAARVWRFSRPLAQNTTRRAGGELNLPPVPRTTPAASIPPAAVLVAAPVLPDPGAGTDQKSAKYGSGVPASASELDTPKTGKAKRHQPRPAAKSAKDKQFQMAPVR